MEGEFEIVEMKRRSIDGQWIFVARPIPQKDITFVVCLHDETSMMLEEIWKIAMICDSAGMEFEEMEGVGTVLKSLDTARKRYLRRYYIVKAEMESPESMTWHFTARPVPGRDVEFRCNDSCIEDEIWNLARDDVQVHMEFTKGLTGENILIRWTGCKT